jgi:hypothetical protein
MLIGAILAAAETGGYGDFIAGLLLGAGVGFLLGPAARSWLIHRQWAEASRRAHLTDQILARMEEDAHRESPRHHDGNPKPWRA